MAYSEKVIDHYTNPKNVGTLDKSKKNVGTGLVGAPECGDVMRLQIEVDDATGVITDAKFKTFGCGSAIASSSLATEWLKGKSVDEPIDEYQEIEFNTSITIKNDDAERLHVTYVIKGEDGTDLFTFSHINGGLRLKKGINNLQCVFPKGFLNVGSFYFTIYIIKDAKETVFTEMDIFSAKVQEGKREIGGWMGKEPGFIKPIFEWKNS